MRISLLDPKWKEQKQIEELRASLEALKKEAEDDATENAYCDEELAKTEAKKVELDADIEKMVAKIDQATSQSAQVVAEARTGVFGSHLQGAS